MKEEITGAGPAFPSLPIRVTRDGEELYVHKGMTLRDYFAAKAMQSLLAGLESGKEAQVALIPAVAYQLADQMLEARK